MSAGEWARNESPKNLIETQRIAIKTHDRDLFMNRLRFVP
jgi:hypothetical protein